MYGSSGNLYRQIVQGAPYDLFLSADDALINKLPESGLITRQVLGQGALVLYHNSKESSGNLKELFEASVSTGKLNGVEFKLAIANPAHAPYGKAARQALESMGVWVQLKPNLVIAEKVSQAAQFARSGAAAFAFVSQSLASSLEGSFDALPESSYEPVNHSIALVTDSETGRQFLLFLESESARAVLSKYGFRR